MFIAAACTEEHEIMRQHADTEPDAMSADADFRLAAAFFRFISRYVTLHYR